MSLKNYFLKEYRQRYRWRGEGILIYKCEHLD